MNDKTKNSDLCCLDTASWPEEHEFAAGSFRIDKNGDWYHNNGKIDRFEMVCLFASMLKADFMGSHWLEAPDGERHNVTVEDAPFLAVEMFATGQGKESRISFRTNVDEIVPLDNDHPLFMVEKNGGNDIIPYVDIRDGIEARLTRPVYYELVARATEEEYCGTRQYGIWSGGTFFVMPKGAQIPDEPTNS